MKSTLTMALAACALALLSPVVLGHCQIPCGIYDDGLRVTLMQEHVTTIEKSMNEIKRLAGADKPDISQIARWTVNKEEHAAQLTDIVTYYFMAQRIKPAAEGDAARATYLKQVELLHRMIQAAMACKQTTDLEHVRVLRTLIHDFSHSYMGDQAHSH